MRKYFHLETFQGTCESIVLVVQMHKIVFLFVTLPRGAVLRYILPIFVYYYLFILCSSISWELFSCFTSTFLQMFLVLFRELPHSKNIFTASLSLLGAILRYFKAHFGVCYSVYGICSILSYDICFMVNI